MLVSSAQVIVAVHLHEILNGVERGVLGRIRVTADTDLHEMGSVAVRGVKLLAKVNNGEVVGPYYAVSTSKHFIFCWSSSVSLLLIGAAHIVRNRGWRPQIQTLTKTRFSLHTE